MGSVVSCSNNTATDLFHLQPQISNLPTNSHKISVKQQITVVSKENHGTDNSRRNISTKTTINKFNGRQSIKDALNMKPVDQADFKQIESCAFFVSEYSI